MSVFLTFKYWINPQPQSFPPLILYIFLIFLALLAGGIFITSIYLKKNKNRVYFQTINQLKIFFITNLIIGMFLLFFGYETVPYLSIRLLYLFWGAGILVHLFFIIKNLKRIPALKKEFATRDEYNKYIP